MWQQAAGLRRSGARTPPVWSCPGCLSTFTAVAERSHALADVSQKSNFFTSIILCFYDREEPKSRPTLKSNSRPGLNLDLWMTTMRFYYAFLERPPTFWVAAGTLSTLVTGHGLHSGGGARMPSSGLTHCLRAWFLLLKYKMSFFLIAWFLRDGKKERGRHKQQETERGKIRTKWVLLLTVGHVCNQTKELTECIGLFCLQKYYGATKMQIFPPNSLKPLQ